MGLKRIRYTGLRPLKVGLSIPGGSEMEVPDYVAEQLERAAPFAFVDVDVDGGEEYERPSNREILEGLSLAALRKLATKEQIAGRSKMGHDELVAALEGNG
jgi:hypothetical protein